MIKLSKLNPLRLIDTANIDSGFDGNFALNQLSDFQDKRCYFQPWKTTDTLKLQAISTELSDVIGNFQIVNNTTGAILSTTAWTLIALPITGFPDYRIYELSIPLSITEAKYYASFGTFTSEVFEVKAECPNTVLVKYKNSENNYDVVFTTGIEFQFRTESKVSFEKPGNEREVYPDQKRNQTQLFSLAFRNFKFYVGYKTGVPFWVLDKYNQITQCDQITYDGIAYQVLAEADFEYEKNENNNFIGASIEIEPVNNNFNKYITDGGDTSTEFIPMQKLKWYYEVGADFAISGIFKDNSDLEKIWIKKRSGGDILLKIGTTVGGDEIGTFLVDQTTSIKIQEEPFSAPTIVYLSGLTGADVDICIIWKQLDEPPIELPVSTGGTLGKGAKCIFDAYDVGMLEEFWEVSTGLGKANTPWFGWSFAGMNGTTITKDMYPIGVDLDATDISILLGTAVGNNLKAIAKANLPNEGVLMFSASTGTVVADTITPTSNVAFYRAISPANDKDYQMVKGTGGATLGLSAPLGSGTQFDVRPRSVISLWVVKITD